MQKRFTARPVVYVTCVRLKEVSYMQHRVRSYARRLADGRVVRVSSHMRSNRGARSRFVFDNSGWGILIAVLIVAFLAYAASKGHL